MPKIQLTLEIEQAKAVKSALELLTRVGLGQITYLTELVDSRVIPVRSESPGRAELHNDKYERIEDAFKEVKDLLGFPQGGSYGIGNRNLDPSIPRAYEVQKVLAKAIHNATGNTSTLTVDSDGLGPRYTNDPAPVAAILAD